MSSREEKTVICIAIALCALFLGMFVFSNVSALEDLSSTYLLVNGSRPLTGNWYAGNYNISLNELTLGIANNNYSFPVTDGLPNQILITDGNGTLTFEDIPLIGEFEYFLQNETSDIATYYNMTTSIPTDPITTFNSNNVADGEVLINFATSTNFPSITILPEGISGLHIHAYRTRTGNTEAIIYYNMYARDEFGAEVLLGTSMMSEQLTGISGDYNIFTSIANPNALNITDRIIIRLIVEKTGVGTLNIFLDIEGTTVSHFAFPSQAVSAANFVPYVGATQNVDLDAFDISATNFVFPNNDIARPSAEILSNARYPLNSNGNNFTTVQGAVNDLSGDGWVYVPNSTFSEAVTISDADVILFGLGWSSIIDGGTTGHAVSITASNVVVRDLQVKTDIGQGNTYHGVTTSSTFSYIHNVFVNGVDGSGIVLVGASGTSTISSCYVEDPDEAGISVGGGGDRVFGNIVQNTGSHGIQIPGGGDNAIVNNNLVNIVGDDGINVDLNAEECVIEGNRVRSWTNEAIDDNSGTSVVIGNLGGINMLQDVLYVGGSLLGWGDGSFDIGSGIADDVDTIYYHTLSQHSDRDAKENIVLWEIDKDSNIILPEVYTYNWKEKLNVTASNLVYGFMADEMEDSLISLDGSSYDPISLLAKSIAKIGELEARIEYLEMLILSQGK